MHMSNNSLPSVTNWQFLRVSRIFIKNSLSNANHFLFCMEVIPSISSHRLVMISQMPGSRQPVNQFKVYLLNKTPASSKWFCVILYPSPRVNQRLLKLQGRKIGIWHFIHCLFFSRARVKRLDSSLAHCYRQSFKASFHSPEKWSSRFFVFFPIFFFMSLF